MTGVLSLVELCANNPGFGVKRFTRALADLEAAGIAEQDGEGWRLTDAGAARFGRGIEYIAETNVPLEPGDDDGLTHFHPGPRKAAAA